MKPEQPQNGGTVYQEDLAWCVPTLVARRPRDGMLAWFVGMANPNPNREDPDAVWQPVLALTTDRALQRIEGTEPLFFMEQLMRHAGTAWEWIAPPPVPPAYINEDGTPRACRYEVVQ